MCPNCAVAAVSPLTPLTLAPSGVAVAVPLAVSRVDEQFRLENAAAFPRLARARVAAIAVTREKAAARARLPTNAALLRRRDEAMVRSRRTWRRSPVVGAACLPRGIYAPLPSRLPG